MNTDDRLNLRARQILDDPTLPKNQRIANPGALLKQLARSIQDHPEQMEALLLEITDAAVREQMRAAIATQTP